MTEYVAFLRGVNVGGRIVKMAEVRKCFEKLGFQNVSTLLQTGNVLFEANQTKTETLKSKIEKGLEAAFHYPAKVQVFDKEALNSIVKNYPWKPAEGQQDYAILFENGLEKDFAKEADDLDSSIEKIEVGKAVIYWRVPKGMTLKTKLSKRMAKAKYKQFNTNRNLNTLQKIVGDK